jgi:hypothetical protein
VEIVVCVNKKYFKFFSTTIYKMVNECRKCLYCNKGLRPFKKTTDWEVRKYHKQCWFLHLQMVQIRMLYGDSQNN